METENLSMKEKIMCYIMTYLAMDFLVFEIFFFKSARWKFAEIFEDVRLNNNY